MMVTVVCASPRAQESASIRDSPGATQRFRVGRGETFIYRRPRLADLVSGVPTVLSMTVRSAVSPDNRLNLAVTGVSTVILIAYDQELLDESRRFARRINLSAEHPTIRVAAGPYTLIAIPTTFSSGLYFLGDGWTDLLVAGGLGTYGAFKHDWRAETTATEIVSALLVSGAATQTIKHLSGRQSPSQSTEEGGRWRPFPSLKTYNKDVSAYDAFPSGHLAAAMATVTVVAENYPEHRWVRPVGYTLMTALSFAMVNSKVHWASDYPLALAIGGGIGMATARHGRRVERDETQARIDSQRSSFRLDPILSTRAIGFRLPVDF